MAAMGRAEELNPEHVCRKSIKEAWVAGRPLVVHHAGRMKRREGKLAEGSLTQILSTCARKGLLLSVWCKFLLHSSHYLSPSANSQITTLTHLMLPIMLAVT